jgi:hypothetical protein
MMDKLAVLLSVAALAVGGWAVFGGEAGTGTGTMVADDGTDARLAALESDIAALKEALGTSLLDVETADAGSSGSGDAGLEGRAAMTVPSRVAAMESELAAMRDRMASVEEQAGADPLAKAGSYMRRRAYNFFLHNAETAAAALKLDDRQKGDLERIVESTKNRLEELYTTANDEGTTWKEAGKIEFQGSAGEGAVISLMGNREKLEEFKKTRVPGTNETYGEAEQRIRGQGKADARGLLTPDQQETWDQAHTDHLFGGRGSQVALAFTDAVVSTPGK